MWVATNASTVQGHDLGGLCTPAADKANDNIWKSEPLGFVYSHCNARCQLDLKVLHCIAFSRGLVSDGTYLNGIRYDSHMIWQGVR